MEMDQEIEAGQPERAAAFLRSIRKGDRPAARVSFARIQEMITTGRAFELAIC